MSRFMETQVTNKIEWVTCEANGDLYSIPLADYEDDFGTITHRERGYGVRESAPGYLDCTEWEVFPTLKEAESRAAEIDSEYEDDDDDPADCPAHGSVTP